MNRRYETTFLIVGGGIAGVSCVETLKHLCPNESIILLTESSLIKTVTNLQPLGKALTRFDIDEQDARNAFAKQKNIEIITDILIEVNSREHQCFTKFGKVINYKLLCLCTGARPKLIDQSKLASEFVIGIRDTESVLDFQKRIKESTRLCIVGNGGIASEIVYELRNISLDWIIKDKFITQTFIDPGAADFFLHKIKNKSNDSKDQSEIGVTTSAPPPPLIKRMRYLEELDESKISKSGAALGPDWHRQLNLTGGGIDNDSVKIHNNCEVKFIAKQDNTLDDTKKYHPLLVTLTNGETIECDLLVSATGVNPEINFKIDQEFNISGVDGGILVDEFMHTSVNDVYAAGDICTANWSLAEHWFQMRLWTQARQMGSMAGKSMAAQFNGDEKIYSDFCFELFGHVTQLFGYQVVLLGKFNGQGLGNQYEALIRMTPGKEYIKYVIVNGKLQGAILIGDTGLEETSENLILNQLDVTPYGDDLLNPDIDIEDYFD